MGSGFPGGSVVKNLPANAGDMGPRVRKIPWRGKWQPTPVFLPEKSQGQRRLAVYSPWAHKGVRYDVAIKQHQKPCCGKHNSRRKDEGERINRVSAH